MIGAIVYKLRAQNSAKIPFINGRFMHAVLFDILNKFSAGLGNFIHKSMNIKPFTVSFLEPVDEISSTENFWIVRRGDKFFWRVTGLNAEILQAIANIPAGYKVLVGALTLSVEKFFDETIFTVEELIFGSLSEKWIQAAMPAAVDKKILREFSLQLRLTEWRGECNRFYFSHDRGTLAFRGKFFYSVEDLDTNDAKVFMLLAKFGEFSGVGRLTGQGFGQTRITFQTGF